MGLGTVSSNDVMADEFVAGHVIFGVGMLPPVYRQWQRHPVTFCSFPKRSREQERWNTGTGLFVINRYCLIAVPVLLTLLGFIWSITCYVVPT